MRVTWPLMGVVVAVLLPGNAIAGALEDCAAAFDRHDYAAALQLCRPLAEQGDVRAQTSLGVMYYNGQGVPRDYVQAYMWLTLVATQEPDAEVQRDAAASEMTPDEIAE